MVEETKIEETKIEETKIEETKPKESFVKAAPRHSVKKILMMKRKSFEEIQNKKQIESIKLWSDEILENQIKSGRSPQDFKDACEIELNLRNERRLKK